MLLFLQQSLFLSPVTCCPAASGFLLDCSTAAQNSARTLALEELHTTHWNAAHYTLVVVEHWHLVYRILVGHCYWGRLLASGYNSVTLLSHTASNTAQNSSHSARSLSQSCNRRMMKMFRLQSGGDDDVNDVYRGYKNMKMKIMKKCDGSK